MKSMIRHMERIWGEIAAQAGMIAQMSVFIVLIETIVYLFQSGSRFAVCLLDPYTIVSYTAGVTLVPIGALMAVFLLREEFHAEKVVRMGKMRYVWLGACMKVLTAAFCMSAVSTVCCGILGKLTASSAYTWNEPASIYCAVTGRTMEAFSYGKVCLMFFTGIFFASWASGMVALLSYWLLGNYLWGTAVVVVFCVLGTYHHYPYDLYRGANYFNILEPFSWKYQVILPMLVILCCMVSGFLIQRRDFLMKERQSE